MRHIGRLFMLVPMALALLWPPLGHTNPRTFGAKAPFAITDLPPGRFRQSLQSLPRAQQRRAMEWLHGFTFSQQDLKHLHLDRDGGVFYADTVLPEDVPGLVSGSARSARHGRKASGHAAQAHRRGEAAVGNGTFAYGDIEVRQNAGDIEVSATVTKDTVFTLHSRPDSANVVFLDFDGHVIADTAWNISTTNPLVAKGFDLDGNPASFNTTEVDRIFDIWLRVSEDLAPFDIDVTTEEPDSFGPKTGRVLITQNEDANGAAMPWPGAGGVAYVNVWGSGNYGYYSPALVYYDNLGAGYAKYVGEAAAHEFGHNLGLSHDGTSSEAYYYGHGSGPTSWAPIMGVGYSREITQWSKGEYAGANMLEDDLAIISGKLTYRPDDQGNTPAAASLLVVEASGEVLATDPESDPDNLFPENKGIIERGSDVDMFYFDATDGEVNLTIKPVRPQITEPLGTGNLDIKVTLYDELNTPIQQSAPTGNAGATVSTVVAPGRYYLKIQGDGDTTIPYSNYASLGQYFITGTVPTLPSDTTPPNPNPLTFSSPPAATGSSSITMTASAATDDSGGTVSYYFECTSTGKPGCTNSGWQTSRTYTAAGLAAGTQYGFRVKARDAAGNQTNWSATSSATTSTTIMHVDSVTMTVKPSGRKYLYAEATIVVRDNNGFGVPSARVDVAWSGSVSGTQSGTTDSQGVVVFRSSEVSRYTSSEFRIDVTNVSRSGYTYASAANVDSDGCVATDKRNQYRICD